MEKKEEEKKPEPQPQPRKLQLRKVELKLTFEDGRMESSASPELFVIGQAQNPVTMADGSMTIQGIYKIYKPVIEEWQIRLTEVLTLLEGLHQSNDKPIPGLTRAVMPMPQGGPHGPGRMARGSG